MAEALINLKEFDHYTVRPKLKVSTAPDQATKDRESKEYEILFAQCKMHSNRIDKYEDNKLKIYSFLYEKCSSALQNKIRSREDYN